MANENLALREDSLLRATNLIDELGIFSVPIIFQKGDVILRSLKENRELYFVERGVVNYRSYTDDGTAVTVLQKRSGEIFGLKAIFDWEDECKEYYIEAGSCVRLRRVLGEEFLSLMYSNQEFSKDVIQYFAQCIDAMERKLARAAGKSSRQRLVSLLLDHTEQTEVQTAVVYMTQQDLAELLSLSRQRVSAHLSKLTEQGMIAVKRGRIEILDYIALEKMVK